MSPARLSFVVLVVLGATASWAVAAPPSHKPRVDTNPAAQARARAIVLTDGDFPAGWRGDRKWRTQSTLEIFEPCRGVDPDLSKTTVVGNWSSSHALIAANMVPAVALQGTLVFKTPTQARAMVTRWALPWATRCMAEGTREGSAVVESVRRFQPTAPGTDAYGFHVVTREAKQRGHIEVIYLRAGPRVSILMLASSPRAFDLGLERKLTRIVAARMSAGTA